MSNILNLLLVVLFDSTNIILIIIRILYIVGAFRLLVKSGLKWYWSIIPWFREYQLARCASRAPEGRVYFVLAFCMTAAQVANLILEWNINGSEVQELAPIVMAISVALFISRLVYDIRIYSGFIEVYGVKKIWLLLCALEVTRFIPMYIWGFSSKYEPKWKVDDLQKEMERLAHQGSVAKMDEGLTINLEDRVVKGFLKEKKYLLKDIHMAIPGGHMVLLLGGSGAGKTTFLNAVNGYEKANAEITLNTHNMYTEYKKMIYEVGFVPQSQMMRDEDTVKKTLMDASKLRLSKDISKKERENRVNEVMDIFGLIPVQDSLVEKLSGGQKKRLSISMEFLSNPSLFILDEPDSGLDGVMARELFERLRSIADAGKIVIVITHSPDRVIDLFDDVIVLAKDSSRTGRLAYYGSVEDARTFFGRENMEQIVKSVNQVEEGGDGLADEYVLKYAEVNQ